MTLKLQSKRDSMGSEQRETFLVVFEAKFGPLSPTTKQRVEEMTAAELRQAIVKCVNASSLPDLGLED